MNEMAKRVGSAMQKEDGVGNAVSLVKKALGTTDRPARKEP